MLLSALAAAACVSATTPGTPPRVTPAVSEPTAAATAKSSSPEFRTFDSKSGADARFLAELTRLDALPIVAAYRPDIGYVVETDATEITALEATGTPFLLRRRADKGKRPVAPHRPALTDGFLYDRVDADDQEIGPSLQLAFEQGVRTFLAFVHVTAVHLAPLERVAIPPEVIGRDFRLEPSEALDASYCLRSPSGRHCLAIYSASGADHREARVLVTLYDANWVGVGSTGRTPKSWPPSARGFLSPFKVEALFEVDGLDHPVFVTDEFAAQPPCSEFVLRTFLPNGQFAKVAVRNGTVADDETVGYCTI
jgi:hypothetical protein